MSAIGPKRTSLVAAHLSAFEGKADSASYIHPRIDVLMRSARFHRSVIPTRLGFPRGREVARA